ncbi:MAG TPA: hypothetical protein DEQ61_19015, partial [Streptomyces sp.]|nr:hypothetical protein [Streptomyces sp.]
MTDPTQNAAGPDDPHGSDPAYDPYAPHTARDPYAAYDRPRSHDPYGGPQEPRPPRTGAYQPNGTPPQSSHGGVPQPPCEGGDPATQVWQGTTHQEHGYG